MVGQFCLCSELSNRPQLPQAASSYTEMWMAVEGGIQESEQVQDRSYKLSYCVWSVSSAQDLGPEVM